MIDKARYDLVVPTSMGVRLTPENRQSVHSTEKFVMTATSAETNVLSIASSLGKKTLALTAFVEDSPIAAFIKRDLMSRGIEFRGKEFQQGGPWGYRHQFNIADSGFALRAPRVHNDRAGEVGKLLSVDDFDLSQLFEEEKVSILHVSGLIVSLSQSTCAFCLKLCEKAKQSGTLISFDLNYRASFWKGREKELSDAFKTIAEQADILEGNEEDFQLCLGIKGPETGGRDINGKIDRFSAMVDTIRTAYPNARLLATTLREVVSANRHKWGAIVADETSKYVIEPKEIEVMDRIGGGDGFVGGLLYGYLNGWGIERCANFAWASGALAAASFTDYAMPIDENQLFSIYDGNARVKR